MINSEGTLRRWLDRIWFQEPKRMLDASYFGIIEVRWCTIREMRIEPEIERKRRWDPQISSFLDNYSHTTTKNTSKSVLPSISRWRNNKAKVRLKIRWYSKSSPMTHSESYIHRKCTRFLRDFAHEKFFEALRTWVKNSTQPHSLKMACRRYASLNSSRRIKTYGSHVTTGIA